EHAMPPTQSITRTRRDRRVRIGPRAYREPRSRGTSITLGDMSSLAPLSPVITSSEASKMLTRTPAVDAVGLEERAASLATRSLFLGGRYQQAFEELAAAREAAGAASLKVILETGELGSYDRVRQASVLAMASGADFIKTSTGKIGVSATLPTALCMFEAARD